MEVTGTGEERQTVYGQTQEKKENGNNETTKSTNRRQRQEVNAATSL
jgi:hypothetical protein